MGYKHGDKRLDQIGRELSVQYVVEGSVRRERDHLRITAQLIQVKDQNHLWAQEYDRSSRDLLALQDDVAAGVAQEIQSLWAIQLRNHPLHHPPANQDAYEAYLRGRYSLNRRTEEGLHNAQGYFHAAADADPSYALAYEGLADCYVLMVVTYDIAPEATVQEARTAAKKAIALDPGLAEPHAVLALIAGNHDWNSGGRGTGVQVGAQRRPGKRDRASLVLGELGGAGGIRGEPSRNRDRPATRPDVAAHPDCRGSGILHGPTLRRCLGPVESRRGNRTELRQRLSLSRSRV
jgi:hypothetical protein